MGARSAAALVLDRHLMRYPFDLVAHQAVTLLDGEFNPVKRWAIANVSHGDGLAVAASSSEADPVGM